MKYPGAASRRLAEGARAKSAVYLSLMELLVYCGMRPMYRARLQLLNEIFKADRAA